MREANFLSDKKQLITITLPYGTTIDSNQLKIFFSDTQLANITGKLVNRIKFYNGQMENYDIQNLTMVNGVLVYFGAPSVSVYFTLKDKHNNVLLNSASLFDYSELCLNVDGAGRKLFAPVRRTSMVVDWAKSYLTLTTVAPVTLIVPKVIVMEVSYTNPPPNYIAGGRSLAN